MSWLLLLLATGVVNMVLAEIFDWLPHLAKRLIKRAASMLPRSSRERYEAEWLAELEALPGKRLSPVVFAANVLMRAPTTARALTGRPNTRQRVAKRSFDLVLGGVVVWALLPILLVLAAVVKLASPRRPVLARYAMCGRDGESFDLLTFRASRRGRHGRLGRILVMTSLDFLPVLFNVLRGELSIVGTPPAPSKAAGHPLVLPPPPGGRPGLVSWSRLAAAGWISEEEARRRDSDAHHHWSLRENLRLVGCSTIAAFRSRRRRP